MAHRVKDIAAALGAQAFGAVDLLVNGASEPASAGPDDLALAMSPAYGAALGKGQARVAVVWPGADWEALGLEAAIIAPRARLAMAHLTQMLDAALPRTGISPQAAIDPSARIGANVTIGAFCVIGADVVIGEGTWIADQVSLCSRCSDWRWLPNPRGRAPATWRAPWCACDRCNPMPQSGATGFPL